MMEHVVSLAQMGFNTMEALDVSLWHTYMTCDFEELPGRGQAALREIFTTFRGRHGLPGPFHRANLLPIHFLRLPPRKGLERAKRHHHAPPPIIHSSAALHIPHAIDHPSPSAAEGDEQVHLTHAYPVESALTQRRRTFAHAYNKFVGHLHLAYAGSRRMSELLDVYQRAIEGMQDSKARDTSLARVEKALGCDIPSWRMLEERERNLVEMFLKR